MEWFDTLCERPFLLIKPSLLEADVLNGPRMPVPKQIGGQKVETSYKLMYKA